MFMQYKIIKPKYFYIAESFILKDRFQKALVNGFNLNNYEIMIKKYILCFIITIGLIFYLLYLIGQIKITADFSHLEPFKHSLPVYYNGFKLGHTTKVYPSPNFQSTRVDMKIRLKRLKLPANTSAMIKIKDKKEYMLKSWEENKYDYLEFKDFCYKTDQLSEYYTNYAYKPHAKYILSRSYDVNQSEFRIYINLSGNKYNIVGYDDATHVLVQKFDSMMELTSQEIYSLNK